MSDELALRKDMERASRAQILVQDELLKEAFDTYENALTEAWKNSPSNSGEAREHAYQGVKAVRAIRRSLEDTMASGVLAKAELDQILGR